MSKRMPGITPKRVNCFCTKPKPDRLAAKMPPQTTALHNRIVTSRTGASRHNTSRLLRNSRPRRRRNSDAWWEVSGTVPSRVRGSVLDRQGAVVGGVLLGELEEDVLQRAVEGGVAAEGVERAAADQ